MQKPRGGRKFGARWLDLTNHRIDDIDAVLLYLHFSHVSQLSCSILYKDLCLGFCFELMIYLVLLQH